MTSENMSLQQLGAEQEGDDKKSRVLFQRGGRAVGEVSHTGFGCLCYQGNQEKKGGICQETAHVWDSDGPQVTPEKSETFSLR